MLKSIELIRVKITGPGIIFYSINTLRIKKFVGIRFHDKFVIYTAKLPNEIVDSFSSWCVPYHTIQLVHHIVNNICQVLKLK